MKQVFQIYQFVRIYLLMLALIAASFALPKQSAAQTVAAQMIEQEPVGINGALATVSRQYCLNELSSFTSIQLAYYKKCKFW